MAVKAVLFDMDGTVTDSEPVNYLAWCAVLKKHGLEQCEDFLQHCIGLNVPSMQILLREQYHVEFDLGAVVPETLDWVYAYYDEKGVPLKKGFHELNRYLEEKGIKKIIATSSAHDMAEHILEKAEILSCFDGIVGGNDVSQGKPHPEPFIKAAQLSGEGVNDCLVIEDSANGIKSALAAGVKAVFIKDLIDIPPELKAKIHCEAGSLDKVIDVIEQLNNNTNNQLTYG